MKKLLIAISLVLISFATVSAQANYRIYTTPKLPMREALERMNLTVAWNTRVKVDGNRDGIFSVQLIPGKENQLIVQTHKGSVLLFDADNGDLVWKNQVGVEFWTPQPAAWNSQSIFVTRRNILHVLNRFNGSQRVYTYNELARQPEFGYPLLYTPNAAPVADEDFLYLSMGDRFNTLFIPDFAAVERAKRAIDELKKKGKSPLTPLPSEEYIPLGKESPQPIYYWGHRFASEFTKSSPLVYGEQLSVLTTDGLLTSLPRYNKGPREELFRFKAIGKTLGAPGQYRNMAFLASDDFNVYAINMNNGRLAWRYVAGAPLLREPHANDRDVFVSPERGGLRRLDRVSGREVWINQDSQRFLAANDAYVYALDSVGRFNVIDARRGTTLATLNLSDWAIAIPNEWTDRIYLAANDGQILCLRHRDLAKPIVMKSPEVPKAVEEKKPMEEPKKEEEKKDDDKKEEKKDDKKDLEEKAFLPSVLPQLALQLPTVEALHLAATRQVVSARRDWAGP
jgi:outer membrane protein assembly factor BamB